MHETPSIFLRDLSYEKANSYLLNIAELTVMRGEQVCIHGRNGSGKTALLKLLCGLTPNYRGLLQVLDHELYPLSRNQRDRLRSDHIGFIWQHYRLVGFLSALDNMTLPCHFSKARRLAAIERGQSPENDAFRLIRQLNLLDPSRLSKPAERYSAGQQQRFAVVRALIGQPSLVLADEPTSALDKQGKQSVYQLLQRACRETGATLICTTHDEQIPEGFDRVIAMDELNQGQERPIR